MSENLGAGASCHVGIKNQGGGGVCSRGGTKICPPPPHFQHPWYLCTSKPGVMAELSLAGVPPEFGSLLTLFQPEGTDYAHNITASTRPRIRKPNDISVWSG